MCNHNGYVLEQVFAPLDAHGADFLARLRPLATKCITRWCYNHYRGFLHTQRKLFEKEEVKRAKTLLYAYRVALTGVYLLETGEVQTHLPTLNERFRLPFIPELIVRKASAEFGTLTAVDVSFHTEQLDAWEKRLDAAFEASKLPTETAERRVGSVFGGVAVAGIEPRPEGSGQVTFAVGGGSARSQFYTSLVSFRQSRRSRSSHPPASSHRVTSAFHRQFARPTHATPCRPAHYLRSRTGRACLRVEEVWLPIPQVRTATEWRLDEISEARRVFFARVWVFGVGIAGDEYFRTLGNCPVRSVIPVGRG